MSQILLAFLVYLKFKCNWLSCIISGSPMPDPLRSLCELNRAKKTFSNLLKPLPCRPFWVRRDLICSLPSSGLCVCTIWLVGGWFW